MIFIFFCTFWMFRFFFGLCFPAAGDDGSWLQVQLSGSDSRFATETASAAWKPDPVGCRSRFFVSTRRRPAAEEGRGRSCLYRPLPLPQVPPPRGRRRWRLRCRGVWCRRRSRPRPSAPPAGRRGLLLPSEGRRRRFSWRRTHLAFGGSLAAQRDLLQADEVPGWSVAVGGAALLSSRRWLVPRGLSGPWIREKTRRSPSALVHLNSVFKKIFTSPFTRLKTINI